MNRDRGGRLALFVVGGINLVRPVGRRRDLGEIVLPDSRTADRRSAAEAAVGMYAKITRHPWVVQA